MTNAEQPTPTGKPPATEEKKKSDLLPRVATAVVALPLLLLLLLWGPAWGFAIVVGAAVVIATWEYTGITLGAGQVPARIVTALCALGIGCAMYLTEGPDAQVVLASIAGATLLLFLTFLATWKDQKAVTLHLGSGAMALLYCGVLPTMLAMLRRDAGDDGGLWVLLAMAVVWGSDSGAYFVGRAIGKHKLAPRVSPKKSIEGALGGVVSSVLAVLLFKYTVLPDISLGQVFLLSIPANVLAQTGDLAESLVKRAHGVKDSGTIIYGHGGLLDRIDALIFAVPWFYYFHRYLL